MSRPILLRLAMIGFSDDTRATVLAGPKSRFNAICFQNSS
jgi:hypothetical protein